MIDLFQIYWKFLVGRCQAHCHWWWGHIEETEVPMSSGTWHCSTANVYLLGEIARQVSLVPNADDRVSLALLPMFAESLPDEICDRSPICPFYAWFQLSAMVLEMWWLSSICRMGWSLVPDRAGTLRTSPGSPEIDILSCIDVPLRTHLLCRKKDDKMVHQVHACRCPLAKSLRKPQHSRHSEEHLATFSLVDPISSCDTIHSYPYKAFKVIISM
jgi:hypothetical protein